MSPFEAQLQAALAYNYERTNAPPDEYQTGDHALSFLDQDDSLALLSASLLESLAFDLSLYYREGWWVNDPVEMLAQVDQRKPLKNSISAFIPTPAALLWELQSESFDALSTVVRNFSRGSSMGGRGGVIRMAKRIAERMAGTRRASRNTQPKPTP